MAESQSLCNPHFVRFHDGEGKWCDDTDNAAGLSEGFNARVQIGRGGPDSGASWSPFE